MTFAADQHFQHGGSGYAAYRPTYPSALARQLTALAPNQQRALDVGCGTGQLSVLLADEFEAVEAVDISADQLKHAEARTNLRYQQSPAESLPFADGSMSLITVGQAAHWFDLPRFYAEAQRVAQPGAVIALVSYSVLSIAEPLSAAFQAFYAGALADFWPPERRHVERGYADLPFPFDELQAPSLRIERHWNCEAFLGYVETWSAVKAARRQGSSALVADFAQEARALWPAGQRLKIVWPVICRLARLS
jgi:SAM-dependent methyltransferase